MRISVNYNELNNISSFIDSKSEEIDLLFDDIEKIIESVSQAWNGKDCKEFIEEAKKKIGEERKNNINLKTFSSNIAVIASGYEDFEDKWNDEIKRESLGNE